MAVSARYESNGEGFMNDYARNDRNRVRRAHQRASYDQEAIHGLFDRAVICHVAYAIGEQPFITPTTHWRQGRRLFWHGSAAGRMARRLRQGVACSLCVSFLDGLVLARSAFHHSLNYRSAMAYGMARAVEDPAEKARALQAMIERLYPGRWPHIRPPSAQEMKATTVIAMDIEDAVMKSRSGPPVDDDEDHALDVWAGVLPVARAFAAAEDDPLLRKGIACPDIPLNPVLEP